MLKVLPILIAVVAADAFGLSYTGYNKYLFDEFQSLNNDVSLSRYRRGANNDQDDIGCCTGDQINHNLESKLFHIAEQCLSEIKLHDTNRNKSDDFSIVPEVVICTTECVFRKMYMIDRNGKLDREALIEFYVLSEVGEVKWKKAALAGYVDACLTKVASTPKATDKQCKKDAKDFVVCMVGKFVRGCPADLRIDSEQCNASRKMFADMNL